MSLAVWANAEDVPTRVCTNARLGGAPLPHPTNPDAKTHGQGGWDVGLSFANIDHLAGQLDKLRISLPSHMCPTPPSSGLWSLSGCASAPCRPGEFVTRLAIVAHGLPGRIYLGGQPISEEKELMALSVKNLSNLSSSLMRIYWGTEQRATILFMGCLAGQGKKGDDLLMALSALWPNRTIVAFTTVGYMLGHKMLRPDETCMEPGMRDTEYLYSGSLEGQQDEPKSRWRDLEWMPWASENSPDAKVILNGQFLRKPIRDNP